MLDLAAFSLQVNILQQICIKIALYPLPTARQVMKDETNEYEFNGEIKNRPSV